MMDRRPPLVRPFSIPPPTTPEDNMTDHLLGVAEAALLVGSPRGTVSAWAHRRLIPNGPYDIPKVLGLSLFSRLIAAGLEPKHFSTIVLSLQHRWPAIVAGADKLYLMALRNRQSLAWSTCVA